MTKEQEAWLEKIKDQPIAFKRVPKKLITDDFAIAAVKVNGGALKYVPDTLKSAENESSRDLCLEAVRQNRGAMGYVPAGLQAEIKAALGEDEDSKDLEEAMSYCRQARKHCENNDYSRGFELYNMAIECCPPEETRYDHEESGRISVIAGILNEHAYACKDANQLDKAIAELDRALELAPNSAMIWDSRAEMYEALGEYEKAIADCKRALELAPNKRSTKEILECCEAVLNPAASAQEIEKWFERMKEDAQDFPQVPRVFRTVQMCLFVVEQFGSACAHFPQSLWSEDLFTEAVKINTNGKALKYVPKKYRTINVCLAAIQTHPDMTKELLWHVPEELRDEVRRRLDKEQKDDNSH